MVRLVQQCHRRDMMDNIVLKPRAVFATRPHPSCCILSYNTRNGALTSM